MSNASKRNTSKGPQNRKGNNRRGSKNLDRAIKEVKEVKGNECDTSMPGNNDVAWYALSPEVLRDAASLPFSNALGNIIDGSVPQSIPGIMVINYTPTMGNSTDPSSPLNLAAMKLYAFIRQANSGSKNYESTDLMMYVMAVSSIYSTLFYFKRALGLLNKYSSYNKYLGRALVTAAGFDYDDLVANQADYRRQYNTIVDQVNMSLHVPKGFKFMERHGFLNSMVFTDGNGKKFQMFVFKPTMAWKFDGTTFATGSSLVGVSTTGVNTGTKFFAFIKQLLDPLLQDEDITIMSGDLLKAYGDAGCAKIGYIDLDYETPIGFDATMMLQIHNIQTNQFTYPLGFTVEKPNLLVPMFTWWYCPAPLTGEADDLQVVGCPVMVQKNNVIYTQLLSVTKATGAANYNGKIYARNTEDLLLDIPVDDPTPGDVMEATRFMFYTEDEIMFSMEQDPITVSFNKVLTGSEVVQSIAVYSFNTELGETSVSPTTVWGGAVSSNTNYFTNWVYFTSCFDWSPIFVVYADYTTSGEVQKIQQRVGDISNYTMVSETTIRNLHEAAVFGEFNVPVFTVSR